MAVKNAARVPMPGDLELELLRKILNVLKVNSVADSNDPRPGDLEVDLLRKILNRMHERGLGAGPFVPWIQGDGPIETYRKILTLLGS